MRIIHLIPFSQSALRDMEVEVLLRLILVRKIFRLFYDEWRCGNHPRTHLLSRYGLLQEMQLLNDTTKIVDTTCPWVSQQFEFY
jgi:4-hydroxy-3-methylbut-2-enyl diphosphate reductase IspH